jgi:YVTN family beta-propeller protein
MPNVVRTVLTAVMVTSLMLVGCDSDDGSTNQRDARERAAPPPESVAGVDLYALPRPVAMSCRRIGTRARAPVLCPTRLPRPSRGLAGSAFVPYPLSVGPLTGRGGAVVSLNFGYSAETGNPNLDGPERFLHFDVQVREPDERLPPKTFVTTLGGRRGLIAPATSRNYAVEPYFANHVRFFWREDGTSYAATLHNFGPRTRAVLGAIIGSLRPARDLEASTTSATGVHSVRVPIAGPSAVAIGSAGPWMAGTGAVGTRQGERTTLVQLDPDSGKVVSGPKQISSYTGPTALATSHGLWISQFGFHQPDILRLRKGDGAFAEYFTAGMNIGDLAVTDRTIWALDNGRFHGYSQTAGGTIERIERETGRTVVRIRVGRGPSELALGAGRVWAANNLDDSLSRIDPRTNRVTATTPVGVAPVGVTAGEGAIWVANSADDTVSRIDAESARVVQTIDVGLGPRGVAVGEGSVWVSNYLEDTVSRIDPRVGRVIETIPVGAGPTGIAVGHGAVWVADLLDQAVSRIEP